MQTHTPRGLKKGEGPTQKATEFDKSLSLQNFLFFLSHLLQLQHKGESMTFTKQVTS